MKIILSPAKKMKVLDEGGAFGQPFYGFEITRPQYLEKTAEILSWLKGQSYEGLKKLWNCSDKIAEQNVNRLAEMDLYRNLTPAVLSYEGLAYQYMAPAVFEDGHFDYVQVHLRILSAFYGVLHAMDGVTPYRLEMQAKAVIGTRGSGRIGGGAGEAAGSGVGAGTGEAAGGKFGGGAGEAAGSGVGADTGEAAGGNFGGSSDGAAEEYGSGYTGRYGNLYDFWGDALYRAVRDESGIIINLASREYSKCIEKYLRPEDRYITVNFCEQAGRTRHGKPEEKTGRGSSGKTGGKLVTKATYAKMARGEMVRFMAEHRIENPAEIKKFDRLGYVFREELSTEQEYVFERIPEAVSEKV